MGRSRASKEQMGMTNGVVPCKKKKYAIGGQAQPVVVKGPQQPQMRKPIVMTMRGNSEQSQ